MVLIGLRHFMSCGSCFRTKNSLAFLQRNPSYASANVHSFVNTWAIAFLGDSFIPSNCEHDDTNLSSSISALLSRLLTPLAITHVLGVCDQAFASGGIQRTCLGYLTRLDKSPGPVGFQTPSTQIRRGQSQSPEMHCSTAIATLKW